MAKVYWDKGHGGGDPGAIGNGLQEKALTAKIVDYGMAYLNNYVVEQKSSRNGDETKSLIQRTNEANDWGADILISVHINSATTSANGFESFVYTNPSVASISLQDVVHSEIMQINKAFGINNDRGKKRANFHMVREGKMPAVLTENLFIVNTTDAKRLKDELFLKAIGEAHARGAIKHLGLKEKQEAKKVAVFTDKVTVPNTAFWQAQSLVQEYQVQGYKCYTLPLKPYAVQKHNNPAPFVIETDFSHANSVLMDLKKKGYSRATWETI